MEEGWRNRRILVQSFFFLLFLILLFQTTSDAPLKLVNLFIRFDPLAALIISISSRSFLFKFWFWSLITVALTLLLGRVFCGWVCPLGSLLDFFNYLSNQKIRFKSALKYNFGTPFLVLLLTFAFFSNSTFLFLDPLVLMERTFGSTFYSALSVFSQWFSNLLVLISPLHNLIDRAQIFLINQGLITDPPRFSQASSLIFLIFLGVVAMNFIAPRYWCRNICPLGALLALLSKTPLLRKSLNLKLCNDCGKCLKNCRFSSVNNKRVNADADCVLCLNCYARCPQKAVNYNIALPQNLRQTNYDPSRREFLTSLALGVGIALISPTDYLFLKKNPFTIRPPGSRIKITSSGVEESEFLTKCSRCGLCLKVCPTNGLQPALLETGLANFLTPVLKPRIGYCDYSCNACGKVCPTGAIEKLSLKEKQKRVIGLAYIDEKRCIPYTEYKNCTVCEEVCPVSKKAIILKKVKTITPFGEKVSLLRPKVLRKHCTGCGICENKCPVPYVAAIRIYSPALSP